MSSMSAEQIAQLVAATVAQAMAANEAGDQTTAKVKSDGPTLRTQGGAKSAKQQTAAKAATLHRNLDPVTIEAGDAVRFVVTPCYGSGDKTGLRTAGAAVDVFETDASGKVNKRRSWTSGVVSAVAADPSILDQLAAAIDKVDRRAHIGPHAPAKAVA